MDEQKPQSQSSQEVEIAVLKTQMAGVMSTLNRIETNHLVHINDNLTKMNEKIDSKFTDVSNKVDGKFTELNTAVIALKINDAGAAPGQSLFWEIVKFAIMALVSAVIGGLIVTKI